MKRAIIIGILVMASTAYALARPANTRTCQFVGNPVKHDGTSVPAVLVGTWDGKLKSTLVITNVDGNTLSGFYAWGRYRPWNINKAGCSPVTGRIEGNEILLDRFENGASTRYVGQGNGYRGFYTLNGQTTEGTFSPQHFR